MPSRNKTIRTKTTSEHKHISEQKQVISDQMQVISDQMHNNSEGWSGIAKRVEKCGEMVKCP